MSEPRAEQAPADLPRERADLLETLQKHRFFLTFPARDLTDEQARQRTTDSALSIGGLIKHVTKVEAGWTAFASGQPEHMGAEEDSVTAHEQSFVLLPGESLQGALHAYAKVAEVTDTLVREAPDLDLSYPLPPAPWFEPGAQWSIRRVILHVIAETAQHAGHADIIRESLDGAKSMG
jgi:uncharacterized damage-inducible protein DinB